MKKQAIYKYRLTDNVLMTKDATILSVGEQNNVIYLWALINPGSPMTSREFEVVPTGQVRDFTNLTFIGTCHMQSGLVFHVFEKVN